MSHNKSSNTKTNFLCTICHARIAHKSNMGRHMRGKHNIGKISDHGTLKCPLCSDLFRNFKQMEHHLILNHDIQIQHETRKFESFDDFQNWKLDFERQTISSFIFYKSKVDKRTKVTRYICHRSGFYSEALGKKTRQRKMKQKGSNKMNSHCPAYITATMNLSTGKVKAEYMVTHVGHTKEVNRLRITDDERKIVADKLLQGVPIKIILQELASNYSPTRRISLTSNHDIHNIKKSLKVESNENNNFVDTEHDDITTNDSQQSVTSDDINNMETSTEMQSNGCENNSSVDTELDIVCPIQPNNNNNIIHKSLKIPSNVLVIDKINNNVDSEHENIYYHLQQSENNNKELEKRKKIELEKLNTLRDALINTGNLAVVNYISKMLSSANTAISTIESKTIFVSILSKENPPQPANKVEPLKRKLIILKKPSPMKIPDTTMTFKILPKFE